MSTHQTTVILPSNNPWFDAPDVPAPDHLESSTALVAFRRTRRKQVQIAPGEEIVFGRRHDTHSLQPDIDLNEYNAMAYGVSRLHAKLRHEEYGWWLEDLASANGTWVNGERLEPYIPVSLGVKNQIILSTFQFYLFLPSKMVAGINVPVGNSKQPLHVVNIEDDRDLQRLMAMAFKESEPNLNLAQFVSGDQALPYIQENKDNIDLYVLDIMLPGKYNGIEIAQHIRDMGAPGYIALTSAFAEPNDDLLTALRAEFFPKPLHILDIIPRLASYRLQHSNVQPSGAVAMPTAGQGIGSREQTIPRVGRGRSATRTVTSTAITEPPLYQENEAVQPAYASSPTAPFGTGRRPGHNTGRLHPQPIAPNGQHAPQRPADVPLPYRPPQAMEFEALEALGNIPEPTPALARVTDSKPLPIIQPLPPPSVTPVKMQQPQQVRPAPVKQNVIQKLISKLRGL